MLERLGYNLKSKAGLNSRKGIHTILLSKVLKVKPVDYYQKTKRGLGYVMLVPSESKAEFVEPFNHDQSFETSLWDFDTSAAAIFTKFFG